MKQIQSKSINSTCGFLSAFIALLALNGCALMGPEESGDRDYDRGFSAASNTDNRDCEEEDCEETRPRRRTIASHEQTAMESVQDRIQQAIQARDVIVGMSPRDVVSSWGSPQQRELAGSGGMGHERWTYGSSISLREPRIVYFENGKVAGWQ